MYNYPSMAPLGNASYLRVLVGVNIPSFIAGYPVGLFASMAAIPIAFLYWKNARNFKKAGKSRDVPCNRD